MPPAPGDSPLDPAFATALADRYRVERELGAGGMATVWLARDLKHDRDVALKVLRPELAAAIGEERFLAEIRTTAALRHPGIVPLYDSGSVDVPRAGRLVWYTMPVLEGETLRDHLQRRGPLPVADAVRLTSEIAEALSAAHARGVVHRDVKPENIMLERRHAVVTDFGIARAVSAAGAERLTGTGIAIGTPAYMSPEQVVGDGGIDARADQYAVGCLLFEMLTGELPYTGDPMLVARLHLTADVPDVCARRPEVPPAIGDVIRRAMAKEPAARFADLDAMVAALEAAAMPAPVVDAAAPRRARWRGALVGGTLVAAVAAAFIVRDQRARWLPETAIPTLSRLAETDQLDSAYDLFMEIRRRAPDDTTMQTSWRIFARQTTFLSEPAGATVTRARLDDTTRWYPVGTTPTERVYVPSNAWYYRYEKPGYRPVTVLGARVGGSYVPVPSPVLLRRVTDPDSDMVALSGKRLVPTLYGLPTRDTLTLPDFLMAKREVTNAEYARFVNAGGYAKREYWDTLVVDGRPVPFEALVARFVDRTGRPGPAEWEGGAPASGTEALPVGGVSWYEARAYARFVGKALPTVLEWNEAAIPDAGRWVVPRGRYESSGPIVGGGTGAVGARGVYDLAGNVREWTENAEAPGTRYILGGGWSDPPYFFSEVYAQPELDRSPINGIRLVRRLGTTPDLARARGPIPWRLPDYRNAKPVDDATFRGFTALYAYDPVPLEPRLVRRDTTNAAWVREEVTIALPGGDRLPVVLLLPRGVRAPFQPVVLWPASDAFILPDTDRLSTWFADFFVRSGRAVIYPIYEHTYGRNGAKSGDAVEQSVAHRDQVRRWVTELRRAVDYAFTRPDIDTTRLAFAGSSWGGRLAPIPLALEPRIRSAVLNVAGLPAEEPLPEENTVNFLPRVKQPVLMLSGKFDAVFPYETSQRPYFTLLGSADKQQQLYDGGHFIPRTTLVSQALAWLDRTVGPVKR